ncbi:hypothetical protein [Microbacterium esteraromaticum]|uniref:hypothetical protein n=1 Tax=Microbacterium esteraromaticum TaxID=57043 RepID=UPI0019571CE1|nr:hypothetical protein [Microbacterium esteraromaticum]MBM7466170.1 hypothetical protein [Microbacterium esteraromaticum]
MSDEHAHDASEPVEGSYTDADHADGTAVAHHADTRPGQVDGEYTDGVYSADGREVHHPHHGEGQYTDADLTESGRPDASAEHRASRLVEEDEGEYTDGTYPGDDTHTGRTDAGHS